MSELKAHLSRYLRLAKRGARIRVRDRSEVVAEIGPAPAAAASITARLADEGRLRAGSQEWSSLTITPLSRAVPVREILADLRADAR